MVAVPVTDLRDLTDAQLRQEWLAFKEEVAEAYQIDGEPSALVLSQLEALKAEMERRGLCLN